jgi:hypothetical protein
MGHVVWHPYISAMGEASALIQSKVTFKPKKRPLVRNVQVPLTTNSMGQSLSEAESRPARQEIIGLSRNRSLPTVK